MNGGTLILTRRDVAALLSIEECTKAVEHVFRLYGEGKTLAPGMLGVPESKTLTICGCGVQGSISLRALIGLFPLEQVFAYDVDSTRSQKFADDLSAELAIAIKRFVAAVRADNEYQQELDPTLLATSKVVVDLMEQCATIGELHHALNQKIMTKDQIHAELGEVVAATKPGRTTSEEVIVFDSTGMAPQDVATSALVYEKAKQQSAGTITELIG